MGRSTRQSYVRQMPKIYGNLQKPRRNWGGFFRMVRNLAWTAVVVGVIYAVFASPFFSIKSVQVQGAVFAPSDQIKSLVVTGKNIWLISPRTISNDVLRYPSVQSAVVQRGLPDSVRIVIQEKPAAMLWISGNSGYVLDDNGAAFVQFDRTNLPSLSGIPRVYDVKAVPVKLGQQVASDSFIQFINNMQHQMATLLPDVTIDHIEVAETTYDVTVYAKQGLKVQLNSLADAGVQIRNLDRLIQQKDAALTSSVDLRVDRWAYVK